MNPKRNVEKLHQCKLTIRNIGTEMLNNGYDDDDEALGLFSIANKIGDAVAMMYELYDIPVPKEDDIPF